MLDKPYKSGSEALSEIENLSLETRRHLHGLFERLSEGMIILILQLTVVIVLLLAFPSLILKSYQGLGLFIYIVFSVFWTLRSTSPIHTKLRQSFTKEELLEGKTYERSVSYTHLTLPTICSV